MQEKRSKVYDHYSFELVVENKDGSGTSTNIPKIIIAGLAKTSEGKKIVVVVGSKQKELRDHGYWIEGDVLVDTSKSA